MANARESQEEFGDLFLTAQERFGTRGRESSAEIWRNWLGVFAGGEKGSAV